MSGNDETIKQAQMLEELGFSLGSQLRAISRKDHKRALRIANILFSQIDLVFPAINGHGAGRDVSQDEDDDSEDEPSIESGIETSPIADDGAMTRVIEYLILRKLEISDDRVSKKNLFRCLHDADLSPKTMNALTTRLSRMKKKELLTWEEHIQLPPIEILKGGREHRAKLAVRGGIGLSELEWKWIEQNAPWARMADAA
jgi:hypothetical protein